MSDGFIGYCDDCHAPIAPKAWWQLMRDDFAYHLWLALPLDFKMESRACQYLLGFAGSHAYTCVCPGKCRI